MNERDARVKERLLLIIRMSSNKQHVESAVASELHKSGAGAYKWYKGYNDKGLKDPRDKPRSGRSSFVSLYMVTSLPIFTSLR